MSDDAADVGDQTRPVADELSRELAEGGRDALVDRLRRAYADAAAAHADIVSLSGERIEALVQNAADHADGLQWRRALAGIAAQRLGVSVAEALSHPAVAQAQQLLGAPSYEQSLAELIAAPVPAAAPATDDAPESSEQAVADTPPQPATLEHPLVSEAVDDEPADETEPAPEPEIEPSDEAPPAPEPSDPSDTPAPGVEAQPQSASQGDGDIDELRLPAIHLGGVADLPKHEPGMEIRLSGVGLDIMRADGEIVGRLLWDEIDALDVPSQHRRRRHRHDPETQARLVVRTHQGDASFEIPGHVSDELRDRVALRLERYRPR